MARTIEERRVALKEKAKLLQLVVNLRANGMGWKDVAAAAGLNSPQRAGQLHDEAIAEGMTPTRRRGLTSEEAGA